MSKALLMILDGWGIGRMDTADAIHCTSTPHWDALLAKYPNSQLQASGENVGLPDGQMGSSEVGHLNIGAGRVVYQDLVKINRACKDGSILENPEIKSIREGKASLVDSYCAVEHGEMYIKQMHIAEYRFGSYANHDAKRDRKLLLQRKEIRKLEKATKDTGKTIIPLVLFINEKGLAKVEIALCQGKHTYDKRQSLREADDKREMAQMRKMNKW